MNKNVTELKRVFIRHAREIFKTKSILLNACLKMGQLTKFVTNKVLRHES